MEGGSRNGMVGVVGNMKNRVGVGSGKNNYVLFGAGSSGVGKLVLWFGSMCCGRAWR